MNPPVTVVYSRPSRDKYEIITLVFHNFENKYIQQTYGYVFVCASDRMCVYVCFCVGMRDTTQGIIKI